MRKLQLYNIFHLNLAYSSIEEEQRATVIETCYWPLLRLASDLNSPFGIEASGYTLESIAQLSPDWITELTRLCATGRCEFIGSGYVQMIGPLVPGAVNRTNQEFGLETYRSLLGLQPRLALINEQTYSAGLLQHYLENAYRGIVMEWENAASHHPEWDPEWRYLPQRAFDHYGRNLPLLWNHSLAFQKFQRYAHGEMELDAYLEALASHLPQKIHPRALCLYGNDVEVFDFRPGRFHTEAELGPEPEWDRISRLFERLQDDKRFQLVPPSRILDLLDYADAGHALHLEIADQPVPTKKQYKYNVTRWGLTGRADLAINSACWQIYEALKARGTTDKEYWKELCYLWSSDFRTHITEKRWGCYVDRLQKAMRDSGADRVARHTPAIASLETSVVRDPKGSPAVDVTITTPCIQISLNPKKGLAVGSLTFPEVFPAPLCGTLPHGYYQDIGLGADFFTGHLVMEIPGAPKVTDLNAVSPVVEDDPTSSHVVIRGTIETSLGPVQKRLRVFRDTPRVEFEVELDWNTVPLGSLRLGYVTLRPEAFDRSTLFYRTHNGGFSLETFPLANQAVDHGRAVSFLVSARQGLGITEGIVEIGDRNKVLRVEVDKSAASLLGIVTYRELGETCFCRLALSAQEMDETSRIPSSTQMSVSCHTFRFAVTAYKTPETTNNRVTEENIAPRGQELPDSTR